MKRNTSVPTRAADMENRTGQKSAARIGIEEAGELIRAAASWAELHRGLAERGMRYVKAGGGAHIYVGDQPIKASTAGHWCSLGKLTQRLWAVGPAGPPGAGAGGRGVGGGGSGRGRGRRPPPPRRGGGGGGSPPARGRGGPPPPGWDDYI